MKKLIAIAVILFVGATQAYAGCSIPSTRWECRYIYIDGNAVQVCEYVPDCLQWEE